MEEQNHSFLQRRYVKHDDHEHDEEVGEDHQRRDEIGGYTKRQVVYGLEDVPPWYATVLFGFQEGDTSRDGNPNTVFRHWRKTRANKSINLKNRGSSFQTCIISTNHCEACVNEPRFFLLFSLYIIVSVIGSFYVNYVLRHYVQFLSSFGGIASVAIIIGVRLCMSHDTVLMGRLMCSGFMVCGIGTLLQSTIGCRLAIIQGQGAFFVTVFAILDLKGPCPVVVPGNSTKEELDIADTEWRGRMLELSGAILVASTVQVIVGATGSVGLLLRFVGPLTITPAVTLLGLALVPIAVSMSGVSWGIAGMTAALVILFSQYLSPFDVPVPAFNKAKRFYIGKRPIFKLFPIILAIVSTWIFSMILTEAGVFPDDPSVPGYGARTDIKLDALDATPWFIFPYPGQWGTPIVTAGTVFGIIAGVLCSILESVGDYYACARISSAPKPPHHAINRGILMEGIACICAGAWGTGIGVTSYSECVGNIGLTRVASRVIAQVAGVAMIILAVFAKVGALFATIPHPIIGGTLLVGGSMVTAIGLSNLQFVDLNSTRNLLVIGFSLSSGFGIPLWLSSHPGAISTGSADVDAIFTILLTTDVFVGAMVGFVLDNTIPGTSEERGMGKWLAAPDENDPNLSPISGYDLPFGMDYIRRSRVWKHLPISPTFTGFPWEKKTDLLHRGDTTQDFLPDEYLPDSNDVKRETNM